MTVEGRILDTLFRRIAPERLLERLDRFQQDGGNRGKALREWFLSAACATLEGYSIDEQELLFKDIGNMREEQGKNSPPFHLLARYGQRVLSLQDKEPVCRFGSVLDWRDTSLCLGQDMIVTAWLAYEHANYPFRRLPRFSWPEVLRTDNRILEQILSENGGISENHCHLYGSAAVFILNWCRLMTWPELDAKGAQWLRERSLQPHVSRGSMDNRKPLEEHLLYAAWIRACLFQRVMKQNIDCYFELRRFHDLLDHSVRKRKLCQMTDALRYHYGIPFQQPDGTSVCLDYAFSGKIIEEDVDSDERILAGERYLLFQCFYLCFTGKFREEEQWVFYLYLLFKAGFREELVQMNRQPGLMNFRNYESRKYALWTPPYWNEAYRTAVSVPLHQQPMKSMELRLSPKDTAESDLHMIHDVDRAVRFYEDSDEKLPAPGWLDLEPETGREQETDSAAQKTFFVLHFVKEKDENLEEHDSGSCRHAKLRRKLRRQSLELVRALSLHPYLCRRIRGIDACSRELGCRPEVFAVPFRFLRECPLKLFPSSPLLRPDAALSFTYHVGEDFYDLTDGLRAVDEAVCFLNLRRGDRLGHALALGTDPELHYHKKYNLVVLPKQDLLDNLIWLYYRSEELGIKIAANLRERIRSRAEDLLTELYRNFMEDARDQTHGGYGQSTALRRSDREYHVDMRDYYQSWLLRGDEPSLYEDECNFDGRMGDVFQPFGKNLMPESGDFRNRLPERANFLENCRYNRKAARLYQAYHYFSPEFRKKGQEVAEFEVTPDYITLIGRIQRAMQEYVERIGLSIECNPSSNTLIGTFDEYRNHPVLRFNNVALGKGVGSAQMHVSLNTDDQGVFETSLSFEYALIAAALTQDIAPDGTRIHADREIEDYVRSLQRMGNEQSFSKVKPVSKRKYPLDRVDSLSRELLLQKKYP